jgi:hypothetical protein
MVIIPRPQGLQIKDSCGGDICNPSTWQFQASLDYIVRPSLQINK